MKAAAERKIRVVIIVVGAVLIAPATVILVLRWADPPISAYMLQARWAESAAGDKEPAIYHHWVDIENMSACMPLAVVAEEDQTFPYHRGFAWAALRQAMGDNFAGEADGIRGASTISQQTVKNLFLWPAKNYVRKAIGGYLTLWMELLWPKRRILEVYLNIAQFGDRVFGVGAAAKRLFGTTAAHLTPYQCAALAAVLPAPRRFNAAAPSAYVKGRIRWVREQMRHLGKGYLVPMLGS